MSVQESAKEKKNTGIPSNQGNETTKRKPVKSEEGEKFPEGPAWGDQKLHFWEKAIREKKKKDEPMSRTIDKTHARLIYRSKKAGPPGAR